MPYPYERVAYWLITIGLIVYCSLQVAGAARLVVGADSVLTILSMPYLYSFWYDWTPDAAHWLWGLVIGPLLMLTLILNYTQLGTRAVPHRSAASDSALPSSGSREQRRRLAIALVLVMIAHSGLLAVRWAYSDRPCS